MALDLRNVKVIIWDLDNTFWKGTISEESIIPVKSNIELVMNLAKRGIVSSICSKNDYDVCKKKLIELKIWDYFVFPSIDWTEKSHRIMQIVSDMRLRPVNVLFLDDEPANLAQLAQLKLGIMCYNLFDVKEQIIAQLDNIKEDNGLERLNHYHGLQKKVNSQKQSSSNDSFLRDSQIKIYIGKDCESQFERIFELINRTNQLNYTKKRLEKVELNRLFQDNRYENAYIMCVDRYCNYGIIGFLSYDKKDHTFLHYLFSCRTIGMGIEQYIYSMYNYPKITVCGDVVTELNTNDKPDWIDVINTMSSKKMPEKSGVNILLKGPCDVQQILPFFANGDEFDTEFSYMSQTKKGVYIESFNHTTQILLSNKLKEHEKNELIRSLPFIDEKYFETNIFKTKYRYIVFSLLTDYSLGLYQSKSDESFIIPYDQFTIDATKADAQELNMLRDAGGDEVKKQLVYFQKNFTFKGCITPLELLNNLEEIRSYLDPETKLILLNGSEKQHINCREEYLNRHRHHVIMNKAVVDFVNNHPDNCFLVDVNNFITEDSYLDTINHYKKRVYYHIAEEITNYIQKTSDNSFAKIRGKHSVITDKIKQKLLHIKGKLYDCLFSKKR